MEPAVAERGRGRFRILVVAAHHGGAAHDDLAFLARRALGAGLGIDHAHRDARRDPASGPHAHFERIVERAAEDHGVRLGHAIRVAEAAHAEPVAHLARQGVVEARGEGDRRAAIGLRARTAQLLHRDHLAHVHVDAVEHGALLGRQQIARFGRPERVREDERRAAAEGRQHLVRAARDAEERIEVQHLLAGRQLEQRAGRDRVRKQVRVRERHAFRKRGRARGVEEERRRFRVLRTRRSAARGEELVPAREERIGVERLRMRRVAHADHRAQPGKPVAHRGDRRGVVVAEVAAHRDEAAAPRVREHVRQFPLPEARVDRQEDGAQARHREEIEDPLGHAREHDRDALAGGDAGFQQAPLQGVYVAHELRIRPAPQRRGAHGAIGRDQGRQGAEARAELVAEAAERPALDGERHGPEAPRRDGCAAHPTISRPSTARAIWFFWISLVPSPMRKARASR